jgi:hypothetical protein
MNTTGNGSKKKIAVTIEMIPDTQTTTTSQMAGTEIVVADETKEWLYEEIQTVEARILEDLKHSHIIAITLLYLILEVIPMIIWNSTILITQINEKAFRESSLITLIHLSLASSLVCFGLKTSSLMTWMGKGRNTLKSQKRYLILLKLIRDSNKEISCIDQTFLALLKKEEQENESVNRKGIEFLRLRLQ